MQTKLLALALALFPLGACSTIVSGSNQSVSVTTPQVQAANCKLQNSKGEWYVSSTPGTTMVHSGMGDMSVLCEKDGYEKGSATYASSVKGWIFGNILFGGLVGTVIDMATGSGFEYPTSMPVAMKKIEPLAVGGAVSPATRPTTPVDRDQPGPAIGS